MLWKVCPYMKSFKDLRFNGFSYSEVSLSQELKRISTVSSGIQYTIQVSGMKLEIINISVVSSC